MIPGLPALFISARSHIQATSHGTDWLPRLESNYFIEAFAVNSFLFFLERVIFSLQSWHQARERAGRTPRNGREGNMHRRPGVTYHYRQREVSGSSLIPARDARWLPNPTTTDDADLERKREVMKKRVERRRGRRTSRLTRVLPRGRTTRGRRGGRTTTTTMTEAREREDARRTRPWMPRRRRRLGDESPSVDSQATTLTWSC